MRSWSSHRSWIVGGAVTALGVALLIAQGAAQEGAGRQGERPREPRVSERAQVDREATAVVRRMADYLTSLRTFRVTADSTTELVLDTGQKIQVLATSHVAVQRPNRLRSERRGPLAHITFLYDGRTITMYGRRHNLYAQAEAPPNLDQALDFARERLEVEAPGADLLYSDVYEGLIEGTTSGRYLGEVEVDGVVCDHVAFQGEDVDWQLWVERGDRPLPRRYVIVTKDQRSLPEFVVELRDWEVAPTLAAADFEFTPPPGATEIEFLGEALPARAHGARDREGAGA